VDVFYDGMGKKEIRGPQEKLGACCKQAPQSQRGFSFLFPNGESIFTK
jgi:hypothetical protein